MERASQALSRGFVETGAFSLQWDFIRVVAGALA